MAKLSPETTPDEPAFIVWFDDADLPPCVFSGYGAEDAARTFYELKRQAWTVHLFKEIARG